MRIYLFLDVVFIYEDTKMPYTHSHTGHAVPVAKFRNDRNQPHWCARHQSRRQSGIIFDLNLDKSATGTPLDRSAIRELLLEDVVRYFILPAHSQVRSALQNKMGQFGPLLRRSCAYNYSSHAVRGIHPSHTRFPFF